MITTDSGELAQFVRDNLAGRSVVLVGLMGAGKTTIGRRLADKLGMKFVDADSEIELAAGMSVPDIFAQFGEQHFREGEQRVIARLLAGPQIVLATGGGAFMHEETRLVIGNSAISVWLRADLDLLLKRVRRRKTRPLLNAGDPAAIMRDLMEQRYPVYEEADIIVDSLDVPHHKIVNNVISALAKHLRGTAIEP